MGLHEITDLVVVLAVEQHLLIHEDLLPAATLLPRHQAMLDELAAAQDFDAVYHRQQIAVHEAALKLHGDFAARGESPTLRAVARNTVPIVRRHLETMRRM